VKRSVKIIAAFLFLNFAVWCQNLEKIGKKDMVTVSGGVNYNGIFYSSDGIPNRRPPYSWFFNGNLNVNILDVNLPFTYSYSNLSSKYSQPFNMTGCAPTYKWVKTYIGYTSMNFSNYTLAGHIFSGAGFELTPKKWKISGMYGRLNKAVEYDAVTGSDALMSYKRLGYGTRLGYEDDRFGFNLIYFTAKDDPNSLSFVPVNTSVLPQENTVVSAGGRVKIARILTLESEYALSGLTRNVESEIATSPQNNRLLLLFTPHTTSQYFAAYKSSLGFSKNFFSLNLNYEHIDPDYKTLGAYYFNNDLENITIAPSLRLFKGKLNLSANTGFQHNNLDHTKFSTNKRVVSSGTIGFTPSPRIILNASYSNFTSYTRVRPVTDPYYQRTPADTLSFYQISQNANASAFFNFGKAVRQTISVIATYQVSNQKQNSITSPAVTILNGNAGYTFTFVKSKLSAGFTYNYNEMQSLFTTWYRGPGVTIGRSFFKNTLRLNLANVLNQSGTGTTVSSWLLSERASITFAPKTEKKYGKPSVSLNAMYTNKLKTNGKNAPFSEFTGMLNLAYAF
jgi:hypothetical protein